MLKIVENEYGTVLVNKKEENFGKNEEQKLIDALSQLILEHYAQKTI